MDNGENSNDMESGRVKRIMKIKKEHSVSRRKTGSPNEDVRKDDDVQMIRDEAEAENVEAEDVLQENIHGIKGDEILKQTPNLTDEDEEGKQVSNNDKEDVLEEDKEAGGQKILEQIKKYGSKMKRIKQYLILKSRIRQHRIQLPTYRPT